MHVVNDRVGSQSDTLSIMCRLQPRLMKATVKEIVDGPWPSDGQDKRFTPDEDPKGISQIVRYVYLHPFATLTSTPFF